MGAVLWETIDKPEVVDGTIARRHRGCEPNKHVLASCLRGAKYGCASIRRLQRVSKTRPTLVLVTTEIVHQCTLITKEIVHQNTLATTNRT